ncbi:three component ABC system middle component [Peribacillus butanolivorans]|uniref:three component ABC system middle component n=1 Tax=Peribacillus butanolivorans TaxID=421767 RepID=UPI0035DFFC87
MEIIKNSPNDMGFSSNLFNNELIAAIAINSVLKHLQKATIAQCVLILPIVSHRNTLNFLKRKSSVLRSMEEFVLKKPDCFVNFDDRYLSLLPVSINAIILLKEIGVINISKGNLFYLKSNEFNLEEKSLGKRAEDIIKGAEKLALLLDDNVANIYLQLRVKL